MYENLISLIAVRKIAKVDISNAMDMNRTTFDNKLWGKSKFTIAEMFFIHQKFFPDVSEEELFKRTETA